MESSLGQNSTVHGTFEFMAPELREAVHERDDPIHAKPTDMWAVGEIMHRLLTKKPAFSSGRVLWRYMDRLRTIPLEELEKLRCRPDALAFFRGLMARAPADRLTADQAYFHDWMKSLQPPPTPTLSLTNTNFPYHRPFSFNHQVSRLSTFSSPSAAWSKLATRANDNLFINKGPTERVVAANLNQRGISAIQLQPNRLNHRQRHPYYQYAMPLHNRNDEYGPQLPQIPRIPKGMDPRPPFLAYNQRYPPKDHFSLNPLALTFVPSKKQNSILMEREKKISMLREKVAKRMPLIPSDLQFSPPLPDYDIFMILTGGDNYQQAHDQVPANAKYKFLESPPPAYNNNSPGENLFPFNPGAYTFKPAIK